MNGNEPLTTFTNEELGRVVSFTKLLSKVHSKVSTLNPTSTTQCSALGRGLIDKLEIFLPEKMLVSELLERCEYLGFKVEGKKLRDKKFYLVIETGKMNVNCFLGVPDNQEFQKVILNPSHANNLSISEFVLHQIFGPTVLRSKIYRLDFTVDIYEEYQQVLRGLDVKYKKAHVEYMGGSIKTGLLIGSGNDKILIYNKAKRERVKRPWTRLERQLSGSKVPIKVFEQLRYGLSEILDYDPLSIVTLNNLEFNEVSNLTQNQHEQLSEFKALIKHEGYFLTRKKLNANKNFQRDYRKYFSLTPYQQQPSDIFNADIKNFFQEVMQ